MPKTPQATTMYRTLIGALLTVGIIAVVQSHSGAARFAGSGPLGNSDFHIIDLGNRLFTPTWTFDFETDGQSITFHRLDVSFQGVLPIPGHTVLVVDFSVVGSLPSGVTRDITPVTGGRWRVDSFTIDDLEFSGTYYGINISNPFSDVLQPSPPISPDNLFFNNVFDLYLDLADFPSTVTIDQLQDVIEYPVALIEFEPGLVVDSLVLRIDGDLLLEPLPVPGDFNGDGTANAADYTVWRDTLGSTTDPRADGTGPAGVPDGIVDHLDYELWISHFGSSSANGSVGPLLVPEPSTWMLLLGCVCLVSRFRSRGHGSRTGTRTC